VTLVVFSLRKYKIFYCLYSLGRSKVQTQALIPANYRDIALKVFALLPKLQVLSTRSPERDSHRQSAMKTEERKCMFLFQAGH